MSKHTTPELMISKNLKLYYLLRHKPNKERRENERGKCKMVLLYLAHDVLSLNEREKSVLVRFFYVTSFLVAGFFFFFKPRVNHLPAAYARVLLCVWRGSKGQGGLLFIQLSLAYQEQGWGISWYLLQGIKNHLCWVQAMRWSTVLQEFKKKKKSNQMF